MTKLDDYKDLINDIAKEQELRRQQAPVTSLEDSLKSAEKLYKMGIPLESISEGLCLTKEQLTEHFSRLA